MDGRTWKDRPAWEQGRPVLSDGRLVAWQDWGPGLQITHLDQTCQQCRHPGPAETSSGVCAADGEQPLVRLFAFRCPGCGRVDVYDMGVDGGQWQDITGEDGRLF